jgi:hypothetical protein
MEKEYKGHKITLNNYTGKFQVVINGSTNEYSSLKSAMNAIDKGVIVDFKPTEVLTVEESGYSPAKYRVRKVTLTGYVEEKKYRSRDFDRYFTTDWKRDGDNVKIPIGRWVNYEMYPASAFDKLTKLCEERNEQEKIEAEAEKKGEKIAESIEALSINLDPRLDLE